MAKRFNIKIAITKSDRMLLAFERHYKIKLAKALKRQGNEIAERFAKDGSVVIPDYVSEVLEDMINDLAPKSYKLQYAILTGADKEATNKFIDQFSEWIKAYIRINLGRQSGLINDWTKEMIDLIIGKGFEMSLSFNQIAEKIQEWTGFGERRAMTIVRTEIGMLNNAVKDKAAHDWKEEVPGVSLAKMWVHRGAKVPRDWHVALDSTLVREDEKFKVTNPENGNTEMMDRPHDMSASGENNVNCGCEVIYVSERYAKKFLNYR